MITLSDQQNVLRRGVNSLKVKNKSSLKALISFLFKVFNSSLVMCSSYYSWHTTFPGSMTSERLNLLATVWHYGLRGLRPTGPLPEFY